MCILRDANVHTFVNSMPGFVQIYIQMLSPGNVVSDALQLACPLICISIHIFVVWSSIMLVPHSDINIVSVSHWVSRSIWRAAA